MPAPVLIRTFEIKKEQSYRNSPARGSGKDKHVPLGLASDVTYRAAMKAALDWTGVYQIVSLYFVFKSSQERHVSYGSAATIEVRRAAEAWATGGGDEGSWSATNSDRAWPGPSLTGTTFQAGPWSNGQKQLQTRRVDVTEWADDWAPGEYSDHPVLSSDGVAFGAGEPNDGFGLRAASESLNSSRFEMFGSRVATDSRKPYLELHYIANIPPNVPVIISPPPRLYGDDVDVVSTFADQLPIEFLYSDPDSSGQSILRASIEVFGDAATDETPGPRIASVELVPSALGPLSAYRVVLTALDVDADQTFTPRTWMRYRVASQDNESSWGKPTSLEDGRFRTVYRAYAPAQPFMAPLVERSVIYGSINSNDTGDYVTAWEGEFYRDTASGAVTLWAPGAVAVGGEPTRVGMPYEGVSLVDSEVVRWRHRLFNRDGAPGDWSGWLLTKVVAPSGPNAMSPVDTSTKLLSRTPTLTVGNNQNLGGGTPFFDGYRARLYRSGDEIWDSGETTVESAVSTPVEVPVGILGWSDGSDDKTPLEWDASIRLLGADDLYGPASARYAIRINGLPGADILTMDPEPSDAGRIGALSPRFHVPYQNADQETYSERPAATTMELHDNGPAPLPYGVSFAASQGVVTSWTSREAYDWWSLTGWQGFGRSVSRADSVEGWTSRTPASVVFSEATYDGGEHPEGPCLRIGVTTLTTNSWLATYELDPILDLRELGTGARLRFSMKVSEVANLTQLSVEWGDVNGGQRQTTVYEPGDGVGWRDIDVPLWAVDWKSFLRPDLVDSFNLYARITGTSWSANVDIRDIRVGNYPLILEPNRGPHHTGGLESGHEYEVRFRFRDDAEATLETELAAELTVDDTEVVVTDMAGVEGVGDVIAVGGPDDAEYEARTITGWSTDPDTFHVEVPFDRPHPSGTAVEVAPWGGWSRSRVFVYQSPPVVVAVSPDDGAGVTTPLLELEWSYTSTLPQSRARVRIYLVTPGEPPDIFGPVRLIWEADQIGPSTTWTSPELLLENGSIYAWEVEAFDDAGTSGTTQRRAFAAYFTPPDQVEDLVAVTDPSDSTIDLSWTPTESGDLDHYRVSWLSSGGVWTRIDGGPEVVGDGRPKLTTASLRHPGGRFGANEYRVEASNGIQESETSFIEVDLEPALAGFWSFVTNDDSIAMPPLRVTTAERRRVPIQDRFDPPGRGSSVHIRYGAGPTILALSVMLRPSEEGELSGKFVQLMASTTSVYVKAPSGWGWEPTHAVLTAANETARTGGMIIYSLTLEATSDSAT